MSRENANPPPKNRRRRATELPEPDLAAAAAIQALAAGVAEPEQQIRALRWIIESAAGTYRLNYFESDRDTAFALGRAFVGQIVAGAARLNLSTLRRMDEHG